MKLRTILTILLTACVSLGLLRPSANAQDILPLGASWEWFHPTDATDPTTTDPDFYDTWHTSAFYDGPNFNPASPAPLGYGTITAAAIATDIGTPDSGNRYTAYFRTTVNVVDSVAEIAVEFLADDGGVMYIDGEEVLRINFSGPDTYFVATDGVGTEAAYGVEFPGVGITAGEHEIAFALHNQATTSSDLGFDIRIFPAPSGPANDNIGDAEVINGDPLAAPIAVNGDTSVARSETDEPEHTTDPGGDNSIQSVWYAWTAPTEGVVSIDLAGSPYDTMLAVYIGGPVMADLVPVVYNDDFELGDGTGTTSAVSFHALAGTTYYIVVDGWNDNAGIFSMTLSTALPGPFNDSLADALEIPVPFYDGEIENEGATHETGEGQHSAQNDGYASIWYKVTPKSDMRLRVGTPGSDHDTTFGVYTSTEDPPTFASLVSVASGINPGEPYAEFDAVAGTTYYIAVDAVYFFYPTTGFVGLLLEETGGVTQPLAFGSGWEWLHPLDGVDPAVDDDNFNTTWQTGGPGYDGPAFNAASPGLLGYGTINFGAIATDIGTPDDGLRNTAYFRTTFTAGEAITGLLAEILADDGAAIYIDGVEVGRVNFSGIDEFFTPSDAVGNEDGTVTVSLGDVTAGEHTIAVSIHNQGTGSSDLGFDLRLFAQSPSFGTVVLGDDPIGTDFDDTRVGAHSAVGSGLGSGLGWTADADVEVLLDDNLALEGNAPGGFGFVSETVDVRAAGGIVVSIDVVTELEDPNVFDAGDTLEAWVEGSTDGVVFTRVATLIPLQDNLGLDALRMGDYTNFSTLAGEIPDNLASLRVVVAGATNGGAEDIFIDNLFITPGFVPPTAPSFTITSIGPDGVGGYNITWPTVGGTTDQLQINPDLTAASGWTNVGDPVGGVDDASVTQNVVPEVGSRHAYFRVQRTTNP